MKVYGVLICCVLALLSCKDDSGEMEVTPVAPANIVSNDSFNLVLEFPYDYIGYKGFPDYDSLLMPYDTSAVLGFDVDGDSLDDFQISYRRWYEFNSNSTPGANYQSSVRISVVNGYLVGFSNDGPKLYKNNELIKLTDDEIMISGISPPSLFYRDNLYLGFITNGRMVWMKSKWISRPYPRRAYGIESYGINMTVGNSIRAGQLE